MRLIRKVRIQGVRSIENQLLDRVGDLSVFVGKNSSGKSNVLRALNLFFNGEIEPGRPMVFTRDNFERIPRNKKKKAIEITVDFELPSSFHLRKEFSKFKSYGGSFSITRRWELSQTRTSSYDTMQVEKDGDVLPDSGSSAKQFLDLISYRYIPNRSNPAAVLEKESQELASSIFLRMKGNTHAAELLSQLNAATKRLLQNASDSLESSGSPLGTPTLATPTSIGEMLRMTGFIATGSHGGDVRDEDWGAGHQAFFLYQVLHSLDTNYARFFGWRQATIWGVEEPESALHRDLETRLAGQLRTWSCDEASRLQILQTTHSAIFTMASDVGYWTELENGATKLLPMEIQALARAAEVRGVAEWSHPILSFPWNPVVLVEGSIDAEALTHVASVVAMGHLRFFTVPNLDETEEYRGKDGIIGYLKRNTSLIKNRLPEAPLIVLLDWETSDQDMKKARNAYGENAERYVLRMNPDYCDKKLGKDFRGIERFYPPEIIENAHTAGEMIVGMKSDKPYSVSKSQLSAAKRRLLARLTSEKDRKKLQPLLSVLIEIERVTKGDSGIQISLPGM